MLSEHLFQYLQVMNGTGELILMDFITLAEENTDLINTYFNIFIWNVFQ